MNEIHPSSAEGSAALLCLRGVHKRFGPTHALRGVDLDLYAGEVLALIGENGAGKSTLVKTLTGVHAPDEGAMTLAGRALRFNHAQGSQAAGIVAVHQETVMFEELSAAENIFIGRQPTGRGGWVDWRRMNAEAQQVLDQVGAGFAATTKVASLSLAQRHLIEIARALSQNARVVILDEPTAALSQQEIRDFYGIVRGLKAQGVAVLFITHKFDEIFAVCDRYVVLRDGATVGSGSVGSVTEPDLVHLMAGRAIEQIYPAMSDQRGGTLLAVEGLSHPTEFADVSFTVRKGEVLGLYGLVGSGRSEVMTALMGLNPAAQGRVMMAGQPIKMRCPAEAIQAGIAFVPEERQRQGGILGMSVLHNFSLAGLASLAVGPWLSRRKEEDFATRLISRLKVKTASADTLLSGLSGGNQQKVIIGKWLGLNPQMIILDEPTKGIDVGAKQAVYHLIAEMVASGLSVILVSSELPEVMHLAHRVLVMKRGRVVAEYDGPQFDAEEIVAAASGLHAAKEGHLHGMDIRGVTLAPVAGDPAALSLSDNDGEECAA